MDWKKLTSLLPGGDKLEERTRSNPSTRLIARLTGPDSINRTDSRWNVHGTDLGHTFEHRGTIYMAFGDTFGPNGRQHRCNALAWLEESSPDEGLRIAGMVEDSQGHAAEIIHARKGEETVIPTYGVSDGSRMYLHYMAVRRWGKPGHWELSASGLAYSEDDGRSWNRDSGVAWSGNSNFGQAAILRHEGYAYFFGIPGGRHGAISLARVPENDLLSQRAYEYWTGREWASDALQASTILPAPVGELSVRWNSHYGRWLMMYLNERRKAIVLRTAAELTGPWGDEQIVATADEYPKLYAPFITPRWNDGPEIYFTMSMFGPYNVFLMRTTRISSL